MSPGDRPERPIAVLELFRERLCDFAKRSMVVRSLITADAAPIDRLRNVDGIGIVVYHVGEPLLRIRPMLSHDIDSCESHPQVRAEVLLRQISFEPPPFFPVRIGDDHRRRPHDVEAVEVLGVFFYVNGERDEVLVNERRDVGV